MISSVESAYLESLFQQKITLITDSHAKGANNQGFRIKVGEKLYFVKQYLNDCGQSKRQRREKQFSDYLKNTQSQAFPIIVGANYELKLSVFTYIEGHHPTKVTDTFVDASLDFMQLIQLPIKKAGSLDIAADCAFSVIDFYEITKSRAHKFKSLLDGSLEGLLESTVLDEFNELGDWFNEQLIPTWLLLEGQLDAMCELPHSSFVSPSDFGLHNMLISNDTAYFIDFEYAGRDSFFKWLCDFLAQPEYPIDLKYLSKIISRFPNYFSASDIPTISFCYQLTLLKWCFIILNPVMNCLQNKQLRHDSFNTIQKARQYFDEIPKKVYRLEHNLLKNI
jgi:hypothetical protein